MRSISVQVEFDIVIMWMEVYILKNCAPGEPWCVGIGLTVQGFIGEVIISFITLPFKSRVKDERIVTAGGSWKGWMVAWGGEMFKEAWIFNTLSAKKVEPVAKYMGD